MTKKILSILYAVIICFIANNSIALETNKKHEFQIELKFTEIVQSGWDIPLTNLLEKYPGGHLNIGDPAERIVSNYIFDAFLVDLRSEATISLFYPFRKNHVSNASVSLIKKITIYKKSQNLIKNLIDNIEENLKINFPQGGPSMKKGKQVGYFIPTDNDFNGINIHWTINQDNSEKHLSIIIQKIK